MIEVVKKITSELRTVLPNSYYDINTSTVITYPYLTFDLGNEQFENLEGFYLDIDVFDQNTSYTSVFVLEENLKKYLHKKDILTKDFLIRFNFIRSNKAPTDKQLIKRRNLQFYCKVYRREV